MIFKKNTYIYKYINTRTLLLIARSYNRKRIQSHQLNKGLKEGKILSENCLVTSIELFNIPASLHPWAQQQTSKYISKCD